jgi:F0F1-type ATP synthase alpha subunit
MRNYFANNENKLLNSIKKEATLSDPIIEELTNALKKFNEYWHEERGESI